MNTGPAADDLETRIERIIEAAYEKRRAHKGWRSPRAKVPKGLRLKALLDELPDLPEETVHTAINTMLASARLYAAHVFLERAGRYHDLRTRRRRVLIVPDAFLGDAGPVLYLPHLRPEVINNWLPVPRRALPLRTKVSAAG